MTTHLNSVLFYQGLVNKYYFQEKKWHLFYLNVLLSLNFPKFIDFFIRDKLIRISF